MSDTLTNHLLYRYAESVFTYLSTSCYDAHPIYIREPAGIVINGAPIKKETLPVSCRFSAILSCWRSALFDVRCAPAPPRFIIARATWLRGLLSVFFLTIQCHPILIKNNFCTVSLYKTHTRHEPYHINLNGKTVVLHI